MRCEVSVLLADGQAFRGDVDGTTMSHEQARAWLDAEFVRLDGEPLRASGKVLLADKLIAIARAAGPQLLGDAAWFVSFAHAAGAALARPAVRIDLGALTVSY